jgi:hypothetical protein
MTSSRHVYQVRPRKDHRGVDLISDALAFGHGEPNAVSNAIGYAKFYSCSHDVVIRVHEAAGNLIETHEQASEFRELEPRGRQSIRFDRQEVHLNSIWLKQR